MELKSKERRSRKRKSRSSFADSDERRETEKGGIFLGCIIYIYQREEEGGIDATCGRLTRVHVTLHEYVYDGETEKTTGRSAWKQWFSGLSGFPYH